MSLVQYGTPLYDDSSSSHVEVAIPRWKKRDEEDRVKERFHGAFTGGFSAGYFNTVGSKEGWAPSSFHSSRKDKGKKVSTISQMRPEDYMDEEDLRDQEDLMILVPVDLAASSALLLENDDERIKRLLVFRVSGGPNAPPSKESHNDTDHVDRVVNRTGYEILAKMGWKPGQGIGPKTTKQAKLGDSEIIKFEVAPKLTMLSVQPYLTRHGIGYNIDTPELPLLTAAAKTDNNNDNRKSKIRKLTMNLSIAANYDDNDDEDALSNEWNPSYSTDHFKTKVKIPKRKTGGVIRKKRCFDGTPVPKGYALATRPLLVEKKFAQLTVPENYAHRSSIESSLTGAPLKGIIKSQDSSSYIPVDSKSRANILQEPQLPGKSVFNFLSPEGRGKIAEAKKLGEVEPPVFKDVEKKVQVHSDAPKRQTQFSEDNLEYYDDIPHIPQNIAQEALSNNRFPYTQDIDKQRRYLSVLHIYANKQSAEEDENTFKKLLNLKSSIMGHNEWINELNEFCQVAIVFRPLKGAIADRFTSKADGEEVVAVKKMSPADEAACLSNYGPLTYSVTEFFPEKLLCKRFNVAYNGVSKRNDDGGGDHENREATDKVSDKVTENFNRSQSVKLIEEVKETIIDPNNNEALESERAPSSLFEQIFGGSDDNDDDDD